MSQKACMNCDTSSGRPVCTMNCGPAIELEAIEAARPLVEKLAKRKLKGALTPPHLYFGTPGGFHPYDYTRCVVCMWPCDYCDAKRGEYCRPNRFRDDKVWTNSTHCTRKSHFQRAKRFNKKLQAQYQSLRQQCFAQAKARYEEFQILSASHVGNALETRR